MPEDKKTFRKAFSEAKKSGAKTFTKDGKKYTTQTASEKAKSMTTDQLLKAAGKAEDKNKAKGYKSKSLGEIQNSYSNEYHKKQQELYGRYDKPSMPKDFLLNRKTKKSESSTATKNKNEKPPLKAKTSPKMPAPRKAKK